MRRGVRFDVCMYVMVRIKEHEGILIPPTENYIQSTSLEYADAANVGCIWNTTTMVFDIYISMQHDQCNMIQHLLSQI